MTSVYQIPCKTSIYRDVPCFPGINTILIKEGIPVVAKPQRRLIRGLAFIVILTVFWVSAALEYKNTIQSEKKTASDQLGLLSAKLSAQFYSAYYPAKAMSSYIENNPEAPLTDVNRFVQWLFSAQNPILRNISIIQNTTIVTVYPYEPNKAVIGRNLALIPAQKETVLAVKNTGKTILTGPVDLVQGGKGIIVRMPVFTTSPSGTRQYWGQVSYVLDYDRLIQQVGLPELEKRFQLRITETSMSHAERLLVWGTSKPFPGTPVQSSLELPGSIWTIEAAPPYGWGYITPTLIMLILLGLLFALLASQYVNTIISHNINLEALVNERTQQLMDTNGYLETSLAELEEQQAELTLINDQLEASLNELKETQNQLIISEKLASLGELVAGVAHEINTPLGIGVTLSTFMEQKLADLKRHYESGAITKNDIEDFLQSSTEASELSIRNLHRASEIIETFKQVAVDQSTLDIRKINLCDYIHKILQNLSPKLKGTTYHIHVNCDEGLEAITYPGILSQILTNLVMNSLIHGFNGLESGSITIEVSRFEQNIALVYRDDGVGIPQENISRVFNPFFSTRRNQGSSGLGLHIVHNLITQNLQGSVRLVSKQGKGTEFRILFPESTFPTDETEA